MSGTYREAVLDTFVFRTVAEDQAITEDWLEEYYAILPHEALGDTSMPQNFSDLSTFKWYKNWGLYNRDDTKNQLSTFISPGLLRGTAVDPVDELHA